MIGHPWEGASPDCMGSSPFRHPPTPMNMPKPVRLHLVAGLLAVPSFVPRASATDVLGYFLLLGEDYVQQTGTVVGIPTDEDPHYLNLIVALSAPGVVDAASVTAPAPSGAVVDLPITSEPMLELETSFGFRAELDRTFPGGTYLVHFDTDNDGEKLIGMTISGDAYPNIPRITNLSSARNLTATTSFPLTWAATGMTPGDFVRLDIQDTATWNTVFETPMPGQSGALAGDATQHVIPANTLKPGRVYEVSLAYVNFTTSTSMYGGGVIGHGGYMRNVQTWIRTAGTDTTDTLPPQIAEIAPWSGSTGVARNSGAMIRFSEPMNDGFDPYTLNVQAAGYAPFAQSHSWGDWPRGQVIHLAPD